MCSNRRAPVLSAPALSLGAAASFLSPASAADAAIRIQPTVRGLIPTCTVRTGEHGHPSPAVVNGVVYVGPFDNKVYALDASTGAVLWTYVTGNIVWSSPAVAKGVVYVGSYDGKVYALK